MKCSASCLMLLKDKSVLGLSFDQKLFQIIINFFHNKWLTLSLSVISGVHLLIFSTIFNVIMADNGRLFLSEEQILPSQNLPAQS